MGNHRTIRVRGAGHTLALTAGLALLSFAARPLVAQTVSETGSTLVFPLLNEWNASYSKIDPNFHMTVGATGSEAGIAQAIAKQVQIGMSDAYMSDTQVMAHPDILNIPLVISAQAVEANLPELHGATLKLSGPVLAGIYSGTVRDWDAAPIAALNSGVRLPHHPIIPVHRADGSGDTFLFTQFLTFSSPDWENKIGYGTTVNWPSTPGGLTARGNQGVEMTIASTPYAVGYVGTSLKAEADEAGLLTAMLENQDGKFVLPTRATITAAAASLTPRTPADERLTLAFAPGSDSYPLINYEYALVAAKQSNPQVAAAISNFLLWCIAAQGGNAEALLDPVYFIGLPTSIRALSEMQIAKIR
jgi:phosphate transport system substrate-binding protein